MKQELIIISDLWGLENAPWLNSYTTHLEKSYTIKCYDSCVLGGIDKSNYSESNLHTQFINGGIDRAVKELIAIDAGMTDILAFSIGGTIAWKYGLAGGNIKRLICISSTRLRKEVKQPDCIIDLYYGQDDAFKPDKAWYESMNLSMYKYKGMKHDLYKDSNIAKEICKHMATKKY